MAKILFTSFYKDHNPVRQKELDHCMEMNKANPHIDAIVVLLEGKAEDFPILSGPKILVMEHERPTFRDFFNLANSGTGENDIAIIANTDIYFDNSLHELDYIMKPHISLALSRWHYLSDDDIKIHDCAYSQDVWIFKGKIRHMQYCDFFMGIRGCDNRISWEIKQAGYTLINPARNIRCIHYHMSESRNYGLETVEKPYWPVPVIEL